MNNKAEQNAGTFWIVSFYVFIIFVSVEAQYKNSADNRMIKAMQTQSENWVADLPNFYFLDWTSLKQERICKQCVLSK